MPRQRDVTSILTWVLAFVTYSAIVAEAYPSRINHLLAYQRLIVREAKQEGIKAGYRMIVYSGRTLQPILPSTGIALYSFCIGNEPPSTVCSYCNELDHKSEDCALAKPSQPSSHEREKSTKLPFRQPILGRFKVSSGKDLPVLEQWPLCLPGDCHSCHDTDHRARDCDLSPPDSTGTPRNPRVDYPQLPRLEPAGPSTPPP